LQGDEEGERAFGCRPLALLRFPVAAEFLSSNCKQWQWRISFLLAPLLRTSWHRSLRWAWPAPKLRPIRAAMPTLQTVERENCSQPGLLRL
jgi:hypothetical protein